MNGSGALETIDRILSRGGDADDVLRDVLVALVEHGSCAWAGIAFVENGSLVLGPQAGEPLGTPHTGVEIAFKGEKVGELWVDDCDDRPLLDRVAVLVSAHVLLGWDTGGEAWEP